MDIDLKNRMFVGIVERNVDPKRLGRCKIRVQGLFEDIDTEDIPWAWPYKDINGKAFMIPDVGKIVNVEFPNDELYDPYYIFSEHYNVNLQKKLNSLGEDEYRKFVALLFDHRTQLYATDDELVFDHLFNKMVIAKDSMSLELKDNTQTLMLGTKEATQQALLSNHFFEWFDRFLDEFMNPTSMSGNLGAPILKPQLDNLIAEYNAIKNTFVSNHVFITDNDKIAILK